MTGESGWTIGNVAARVGLDVDTLRYYERRGVLPHPARDAVGRRQYDDNGVHLIEVLLHLKGTGMPLEQIAGFTRLVALDPGGVRERLELLIQHREAVRHQIVEWNGSLQVIDGKIRDYTRRLDTNHPPETLDAEPSR